MRTMGAIGFFCVVVLSVCQAWATDNEFSRANPGYRERAGAFYEKEHLGKAVEQLAEMAELNEQERTQAREILRQFIYDWLDTYVRNDGRMPEEERGKLVAAMDEKFGAKLETARFAALYLRWRKDATGAKNTLAFLMRPSTPGARQLPPALQRCLVLHYSFDRPATECVEDESGHGRGGKVFGAQWIGDGKSGGALRFDGIDDMVEIQKDPIREGSYTVSLWFTSAAIRNFTKAGRLISRNCKYQIGTVMRNDRPCFYTYALTDNYGVPFVSMPVSLETNTWHHIALSVDAAADRGTFYFDGKAIGTGTGHGGPQPGSLRMLIGALTNLARPEPGDFWEGLIDEVMIFDRVLSEDEVRQVAGVPDEGGR